MNLYQSKDIEKYEELLDDEGKTSMLFCPECDTYTTFKICESYEQTINAVEIAKVSYSPGKIISEDEKNERARKAMFNNSEGIFVQAYECCMNSEHKRYNIYHRINDKIIKIGQYPSDIDDNSKEYLDKLNKICDNSEAKEITKYIKTALIMESHGYGIASLVYMRRAFEKLIIISEEKLNIDSKGKLMKDRIKDNILLPEEIKNNARIYNIISEGLHNQPEEECLDIFKAIKIGVIILISKTYSYIEEEKYMDELSKLVSKL